MKIITLHAAGPSAKTENSSYHRAFQTHHLVATANQVSLKARAANAFLTINVFQAVPRIKNIVAIVEASSALAELWPLPTVSTHLASLVASARMDLSRMKLSKVSKGVDTVSIFKHF